MIANYLIYLALSATITVLTGHTLHRHGRAFLVDVFRGNSRIADAVNHLLLVGFYLVNLGIAAWGVTCGEPTTAIGRAIEEVGFKLGVMSLILGGMHCVNVTVLCAIRRRIELTPLKVVEFIDE